MLIILTGEIGTGKTTKLKNWSEKNPEFKGILQLNINGRRILCDVSTQESKELSTNSISNTVQIGKYKFDIKVMQWGSDILEKLLIEEYPKIIVDEYGKLEIAGEGLEPTIGKLINKSLIGSLDLILVIRKNLLEDFLKKYSIAENNFKYFYDVYED